MPAAGLAWVVSGFTEGTRTAWRGRRGASAYVCLWQHAYNSPVRENWPSKRFGQVKNAPQRSKLAKKS